MDTPKRYVVGFAFSKGLQSVLLIRKNRPKWQEGRLNGVGGKVEPGEDYLSAMVREFREETGLDIPPDKWKHVVTYYGPEYEVRFFYTVTDAVNEAVSMTDEHVALYGIGALMGAPVISNLRWIIPLCLDQFIEMPVIVREPS